MKKPKKRVPVCGQCGSDNLSFDALASWNTAAQCFEMSQILTGQNPWCRECDMETREKWKEIK